MADLVSSCPPEWEKTVRPFLQRACDFDAKQPLVAYFLRTHAGSLASKLPRNPASTKFLMSLLDKLEAFKAQNAEVANTDGRTLLTRTGLMLFTKADDFERDGRGDAMVLKLFFSASQILEATKQFTSDGKLDPVAEEKVKYARYMAASIKKSMDSGQPYVSPNAEPGSGAGASHADPAAATGYELGPPPLPAAATAVSPGPGPAAYPSAAPPAPPPAAANTYPPPQSVPPPQQPYSQSPQAPQQPPPAYPQAPVPPPTQPPLPQPGPSAVAPPAWHPATPQPTTMYTPPAAPSNTAQQMDKILEAQKFAKQAVSALQFYDTITARKLLIDAINVLDGQAHASRH